MAFQNGGFVITTATQYIGKTGVDQDQLRRIARILNVDVAEPIKTIVAFSKLEDKK